ncbi:cytochrome P450 [Nannocystis pusilla]|uniref:Cytochrome P450 n=1 Tax=Nannocystis pusilla TaxID=889268 RepID=A0ABS7TWG0_9BACT|nr:cytochrome P450 [Nannocystis pusilla]MBZ5712521.1 cytochrome P450 [Nannocystis pusilla]
MDHDIDLSTALFSPEVANNPHPLLRRLREAGPVHRLERYGWWAVTRHADVTQILRRPDVFSSDTGLDRLRPPYVEDRAWQEIERSRGPSMVNSDPPAHTRLRRLIAGAFAPRAMARIEARVHEITADLLDRIVGCERFDVVDDLAIPLPVTVIAEMLGVDTRDKADFKRWSDELLEFGQLTREQRMSPAASARLVKSRCELIAYLEACVEARREAPRDDLISELVRAESEEGKLTANEVLGMLVLLLIAGNETTTNLIATGTHLLLEHPEALAELRADPSLVPNFLEEVLRYDGPVTMLFRRTTEAVEVAGTTIPRGALVLPLVAAANRDPDQFSAPDRFDIRRDTRGHLGFGHGIHFCVGAPLSRLEGRIAFTELLRRLPPFARVDTRPSWRDNSTFRALQSLRLRFERRAA